MKSLFLAHDTLNTSEWVFLNLLSQIVGDHLLPFGLIDEAFVQRCNYLFFVFAHVLANEHQVLGSVSDLNFWLYPWFLKAKACLKLLNGLLGTNPGATNTYAHLNGSLTHLEEETRSVRQPNESFGPKQMCEGVGGPWVCT